MLKSTKKKIIKSIGPISAYWILNKLHKSNQAEIIDKEHIDNIIKQGKSCLIASWHNRTLIGVYLLKDLNYINICSPHTDGELMAKITQHFGWRTIIGSSNHNASHTFREILKHLKQPKQVICLTPDGPKGPAKQPKPGIIRAAQISGCPIIPTSTAASNKWTFNTWDKYQLSKPWGKIILGFGKPIYFNRKQYLQTCSQQLTEAINKLYKKLDKLVNINTAEIAQT